MIPAWRCGCPCFLIQLFSEWRCEWLLVFILLSVLGEQRDEADGSSYYVPTVYAGELQVGCHILLHPSQWVNACEEFKMFPSAKRGRARQGGELGGFVFTNNCNYFRKQQKCKPEQHNSLPRSDSSARGKTTKGWDVPIPTPSSVLLAPPKQGGRSRNDSEETMKIISSVKMFLDRVNCTMQK